MTVRESATILTNRNNFLYNLDIMKTKISVALVIFSLFFTTAQISTAQTAPNDWNAVKNLAAGTNVYIRTFKGAKLKGDLVAVSDNELDLSVKGKTSKLAKGSVEEIYFTAKKSGKRGRIIGAIAGLLTGGVAAGAVNRNAVYEEDFNWSATIVLPLAGLIGGAYLGGLLGKGKKKGALIYKAN